MTRPPSGVLAMSTMDGLLYASLLTQVQCLTYLVMPHAMTTSAAKAALRTHEAGTSSRLLLAFCLREVRVGIGKVWVLVEVVAGCV